MKADRFDDRDQLTIYHLRRRAALKRCVSAGQVSRKNRRVVHFKFADQFLVEQVYLAHQL